MSEALRHAIDEFVHSPIEALAALVIISAAIFAKLRSGGRLWVNLWTCLRAKSAVPSETLRIVQNFNRSSWGYGSVSGNPAMQVMFEGDVTDLSGKLNKVLRAEIPKPLTHALMLALHDNCDT